MEDKNYMFRCKETKYQEAGSVRPSKTLDALSCLARFSVKSARRLSVEARPNSCD